MEAVKPFVEQVLDSFKNFGGTFVRALDIEGPENWMDFVKSEKFENFMRRDMSEYYITGAAPYRYFPQVYKELTKGDYWDEYEQKMIEYIDLFGEDNLIEILRTSKPANGPVYRKILEKLTLKGSGLLGAAVGGGLGVGLGSLVAGRPGAIIGGVTGAVIGASATSRCRVREWVKTADGGMREVCVDPLNL